MGKKHEHPHFLAFRAFIQNRLNESSNLAREGMHSKFQSNHLFGQGQGGRSKFTITFGNWKMPYKMI